MRALSLILFFIIYLIPCEASFEQHYRKLTKKEGCATFRNVDYIYLINLDQRPEKLHSSLQQLIFYGLYPQRFPAIYGWRLPASVFTDVGVKYLPGMWPGKEHSLHFPPNWNGSCQHIALNESWYGKTIFNGWITHGAIGCTLSHLSVLQDAYDSGYNTIWVLEDDFFILQDPRRLSIYIDRLDELVGENNWDVLYTDCDYLTGIDENKDLLAQMPYKWRPDMPGFDLRAMLEHTEVGEDFIKIGCRIRTHSMIVRRSGIQKILDFYKTHYIFMPYDHEIAFVPDIRLYVIKQPVVTNKESISDIKELHF